MVMGEQSQGAAAADLVRASVIFSTERDLDVLLTHFLDIVRTLTKADQARIYLLDETKRRLLLRQEQAPAGHRLPDTHRQVELFVDNRQNMSRLAAACAFTGAQVFVPDIYAYSGYDFSVLIARDRAARRRLGAALAGPLKDHQGKTIGVFELMAEAGGAGLIRSHSDVMEAFACQAAVALDNRILAERNRALIKQLDQANRRLTAENTALKESIAAVRRFDTIIGRSPAMMRVFQLMDNVIGTDATVLIRGETGTGKELVAQAIHRSGPRAKKPFVTQNCAALPEQLLESELFGHRKGAFTGATEDRKGLFEAAQGGTIFLDEIGDMPLALQAKVLRVLQEREVRPVGANQAVPVDVRVIAATHQDLPALIREGAYREDLYYRLCVFPIDLPPLRDRAEDLPLLIDHFLGLCAKDYDRPKTRLTEKAMAVLLEHGYPGNIRELRNILSRAVLMAPMEAAIDITHLPPGLAPRRPAQPMDGAGLLDGGDLRECLRRFEAKFIAQSLAAHDGNRTRTAQSLKISRRSLLDKIQRYGIGGAPPAHGARDV